jgi:hypothetical protein
MQNASPLPERIVAVGLLTRRDLDVLGPTFDRIWPVEEAPHFSELLRAIDEADRRFTQGGRPRR